MFQYSMRTLLLVALVVSLFCTALANPTQMWDEVIFTLTTAMLLTSAVMAAVGRRSFALGFAVTGWLYFALVFIGNYREDMLTDRAVRWLCETLCDDISVSNPYVDLNILTLPPPSELPTYTTAEPNPRLTVPAYYPIIGHCLFTLILATIGGLAATWLQRPPDDKPKHQHEPT